MLFDIILEVTGFEGTFEMLVEQVRRHELDVIHGSDFEAVDVSGLMVNRTLRNPYSS